MVCSPLLSLHDGGRWHVHTYRFKARVYTLAQINPPCGVVVSLERARARVGDIKKDAHGTHFTWRTHVSRVEISVTSILCCVLLRTRAPFRPSTVSA